LPFLLILGLLALPLLLLLLLILPLLIVLWIASRLAR